MEHAEPPPFRPHRRRRQAWLAAGVAVAVVLAVTGRYFVWPASDALVRADAIIVLGGPGPRTSTGMRLAREGWAREVAISVFGPRSRQCRGLQPPPAVEVSCFRPEPFTTQGEARYVARLAADRHWRTLIVVAGREQVVRARLRSIRCFTGRVVVVGVDQPTISVPYRAGYEAAAMLKALLVQRSC